MNPIVLVFLVTAFAYAFCLRLIFSPHRNEHPEFPFVGTLGLFGLYHLSRHLFQTFGLTGFFPLLVGCITFGSFAIFGILNLKRLFSGLGRSILWLLKLIGIFFVVDFTAYYLSGFQIMQTEQAMYYPLIQLAENLGFPQFGAHMLSGKKSLIETVAVLDCALSAVSLFEGIPSGLRFISPRLPIVPTLLIMALQTKQRSKRLYCSSCKRNLSYRELVQCCPKCRKVTEIKLMSSAGFIFTPCANDRCNSGWRHQFSTITPISKKRIASRGVFCKYCNQPIGAARSHVMLSLYGHSTEMVQQFRQIFCARVLNPDERDQADPERLRLAYSAADTDLNVLRAITNAYNGSAPLTTVPFARIAVTLKGVSDETMLMLSASAMNRPNSDIPSGDGLIFLLDASLDADMIKSYAETLALNLAPLMKDTKVFAAPILVGLCADNCPELAKMISDGFRSGIHMDHQCRDFLKTQRSAEAYAAFTGIKAAKLHFFVYRTGSPARNNVTDIYNVIPAAQALAFQRVPALRRIWKVENGGCLPTVTGQ